MRKFVALVLALSAGIVGACSSDTTSPTTATATGDAQTSALGGACKASSDCDTGLICSADDPGGQCLKACAATSDCPSGATCTDEKICYLSCAQESDCTRSGYACVDAMTVTGEKTLTCDVAPAAGSGKVGDLCRSTADCEKALICETGDPRGQCVVSCKAQSDCPAGSTCTDEKICYASCTEASDCPRVGYDCVDSMTIDGTPTKTCDTPG